MNTDNAAYAYSRKLLGPIFHHYLFQLDNHIRYFAQDQDARVLFVSRAGLRIRRLYQLYLEAHGKTEPAGMDYLWASRMMAAKAVWQRAPALSCSTLAPEFRHGTLGDVVKALYAGMDLPASFKTGDAQLAESATRFQEFVWSQHPVAHDVRWMLTQQSEWFEAHWKSLVGDAGKVVLVDSGWAGTIQRVLADAYPEHKFWGLYFGRAGVESTDRRYWDHMIGLAFETDTFVPSMPASAVTMHRHLIESLLEPEAPSIERIVLGHDERPYFVGSTDLLQDRPTLESAPVFMGVLDYLQAESLPLSLSEITARAHAAARELALVLAYPTEEQARALGGMSRSADFGRSIRVSTLLEPRDRFQGDSAEKRISDALWPNGQAALEYDQEIVPHRQKLDVPGGHSRVNLKRLLSAQGVPAQHGSANPVVAVITRTMDRPIFLRRAIASVAAQQYKHYVHVIVCDGGDIEAVRETVQSSAADISKVVLVDNVVNRGMEAASNIAIRSCESDYIVIHDDDDTWESTYLQKMVDFLESGTGQKYGGAISHCHYISEEVLRDSIVERSRQGYNDWVTNVQLLEMATANMFAPIAFLFRRAIYDQLEGFDEKFPVLGDWDFNLRFLLLADIGVLPERLAKYHHRDVGNKRLFGNSVIAGIDKHAEFNSVMRNKHLRLQGTGGDRLAMLTTVGMAHAESRTRNTNAVNQLSALIKARTGDSKSLPAVAWDLFRRMSGQLEDRWNTISVLMQQLERARSDQAPFQK